MRLKYEGNGNSSRCFAFNFSPATSIHPPLICAYEPIQVGRTISTTHLKSEDYNGKGHKDGQ